MRWPCAVLLGATLGLTGCDESPGRSPTGELVGGEGSTTGGDTDSRGMLTTSISASGGGATSTTAQPPGPSCDDETPCDDLDDDPCTVARCESGRCIEEPLECDMTGHDCAEASCDPQTGECVYTPDDAQCSTDNVCEIAVCELVDAGSQCTSAPQDDVDCDDDDPCTTDDRCSGGTCAGEPIACAPERTCAGTDRLEDRSEGACVAGACEYGTVVMTFCPLGCSDAACETPEGPIITEFLYDAVGGDGETWIELWAPPGSSLAGLTLDEIDGTNGETNDSLDLTGTAPETGFVLIVNSGASPQLQAQATLIDAFADLENAEESLVLRRAGTVLDAVGFGPPSQPFFAGEGSPVAAARPGESLARSFTFNDTNDNSLDFRASAEPTPGALNH